MSNVMEDVCYWRKDFLWDPRDHRHPPWITEKHFIYHLIKDTDGVLVCVKDPKGRPLTSPRRLIDLCIHRLVCEPQVLNKVSPLYLPSNTYPVLLTEAIYQREALSIEWVISTWPQRVLRVYDVIPKEDYLECDYLTLPFEGNENMCLLDCIILGILKLKPEARLKRLDFTWFDKDRKLCRELCRLPILWMSPSDRTVENIHDVMAAKIDVTKDKVQRFLNRISTVYRNVDSEFKHGNGIDPLTIIVDLKVTIDDVPLGLSLQTFSPFKFACNRLWMKHIPEVSLLPTNLGGVLDTATITHFEYEDPLLSHSDVKLQTLIDGLTQLKNLQAISLPNSLDSKVSHALLPALGTELAKLRHLIRVNLAYNNLQGYLETVLGPLRQRLEFLNLKDCRLVADDLFFLLNWRPLCSLYELNLSCHNLKFYDSIIVSMLQKMSRLTCFAVSFCALSVHSQVLILRELKECSYLKVLAMQSYTPLPREDVLELLHISAQIRTLQKVLLFPQTYAFPGNNEQEREASKYHMLRSCYRYLILRSRSDIELEEA